MRILLVQPNYPGQLAGLNDVLRPEPLALELLAAAVGEHDVRIVDLRIKDDLLATLESFQPNVVGVTALTANSRQALRVCRVAKGFDANAFTVVGGYHASLSPQDFDDAAVDAVVAGEGEVTFVELVNAVETGKGLREVAGLRLRQGDTVGDTGKRLAVKDIDSLPLPARHLTAAYREDYSCLLWPSVYALETARGCPYRCNFCAVWYFHHGKCRLKSPPRVMEDLSAIPGRNVFVVDDNFLQDVPRAERIGRMVSEARLDKRFWVQARSDSIVRKPGIIEQWAGLGLSIVSLGFEASREDELEAFNKHNTIAANEEAVRILKANGIKVWGCFIIDPAWSERDFDNLLTYLGRLRLSFHQFTVLTPIPGTGFFGQKVRELLTTNYERFDFLHSVLPTKLPLAEFYKNVARLYAFGQIRMSDLRQNWKDGDLTPEVMRRLFDLRQRLTNPSSYLAGV